MSMLDHFLQDCVVFKTLHCFFLMLLQIFILSNLFSVSTAYSHPLLSPLSLSLSCEVIGARAD